MRHGAAREPTPSEARHKNLQGSSSADQAARIETTKRIRSLGRSGRVRDAISELASLARLGVQPDAMAATSLLHACVENGRADLAENVFNELFADDALVPDEIAFSVLIRGMGRSKPPRWDSIMALLDTMEGRWGLQPSAPVFNALLDICVRTEDDARADTLLDRMWTGGVAPDAMTLETVRQNKKLRSRVKRLGAEVVLAADRLCYAPSPDPEEEARYIPLDRVPVRAMPRGYAPGIGAGLVDDRHLDPGRTRAAGAGCVFSLACGSHVHLFAASSPEDAQMDDIVGSPRFITPSLMQVWVRRAATGTGSHVPTARPLAVPAVYEIRVTTGDRRDAGTSAQVVMELHGVEASSGEHTLVPAPGTVPFQRGTQSTMKIRCPCLGRLRAVTVMHDASGPQPSWWLDEVRVRQRGSDANWAVFPCRQWLCTERGDGRIMRRLACAEEPTSGLNNAMYRVDLALSDPLQQAVALTVVLEGRTGVGASVQGTSPSRLELRIPEHRTRHQEVAEGIQLDSLDAVSVTSDLPDLLCLLRQVSVTCLADGRRWTCLPKAREEPGKAGRTLRLLLGDAGATPATRLPAQPADFSPGTQAVFRLCLAPVGALRRLVVSHDAAGLAPHWHLDWAEVLEEANGASTAFLCRQWLSRDRGPGQTRLTLVSHRGDPRAAPHEYSQAYRLEEVRVACPSLDLLVVFQAGRRGREGQGTSALDLFPADAVLAGRAAGGADEVARPPTDAAHSVPDALPTGTDAMQYRTAQYRIRVATCPGTSTGMSAQVALSMHDAKGCSVGPLRLSGAGGAFQPGSSTEFQVEAAALEGISSITLEMDASSPAPAWKLDWVEVEPAQPTRIAIYTSDCVGKGHPQGLTLAIWTADPGQRQTLHLSPPAHATQPGRVAELDVVLTLDLSDITGGELGVTRVSPAGATWHCEFLALSAGARVLYLAADAELGRGCQSATAPLAATWRNPRADCELYCVSLRPLGALERVELRCDRGAGPWLLDSVLVEGAGPGARLAFLALHQAWVAGGDRLDLPFMPAGQAAEVEVTLHCQALCLGPSARPYLVVLGHGGSGPPVRVYLPAGPRTELRRAVLTHTLTLPRAVKIQALAVGVQGLGAAGYLALDWAVVESVGEAAAPQVCICTSPCTPAGLAPGTNLSVVLRAVTGASISSFVPWKPGTFLKGTTQKLQIRGPDLGPTLASVSLRLYGHQPHEWEVSGVQVAQLGARREPQLLVPATPTDGGALRFVPGTPPKRAAVSPTSPAQAPAAGGSRLVHVAVHTSALPPGGTTARTQVGLVGVTGSTPLQALSHGARAGSVHSVAVDAYGIGRVRRVVLASDGTGAGKVSLFPSPLHESDEEESSVEVAEHVPAAAVKNTGRVGKQAAGQGMRAARSPTASPASEATEGEEEEAESVAALHAFQLAVHMTQGMAARGVPPASLVLQPAPDPSDPGGADSIQLPGRDLRAGGCAEFDLQLPAASPPAALSLRLEGGGRGARLHVDRLELRREGGAEPVVYSFSRWVTHALVTTAAQEPDRPSCTVAIDVLEVEGRLASGLLHLIFTDAAGVTAEPQAVDVSVLDESGPTVLETELCLERPADWQTWVSRTEHSQLQYEGKDGMDSGEYRLQVQTSDLRGAGLHPAGRLFVVLEGELGRAGPFQFGPSAHSSNPPFQRGQLDAFELVECPDVGALHSLEVWVEGSRKLNWHPAWIKVRLELVGEQSSSGVLRLARGRRSFRPGSEDTFTFPHIPWLGDIRCIRVATDGSGLFPAWHLRCVHVWHLSSGRRWRLDCRAWIDRRCNNSRWLSVAEEGGAAAEGQGLRPHKQVPAAPGPRQGDDSSIKVGWALEQQHPRQGGWHQQR
ncbi:Lipoxygenase-like proteiny domain-containing protein 1 [Auxenochlorella protothecoides]|uniref:Lipoxygenase-like proteiny domain-containing protein 1 n=1 Tax=Auxenochlorella protothecoides TaxID=3075 RepID=A0A087SKB9_AUXPR|nr:Lipoxygenase-like proteiny domain-containing protein 1 [Auxenochlorella protothecoides]KFM26173.1 Lipoxygenase-like proteiny domain-containing protein 1 [Auxenochlorella protothecoides]